MAEILAFAGSNSSTSINYRLVQHTTSLVNGRSFQLLNMAQHPFPLYSEDAEKQNGFSSALMELNKNIQQVDGLIISVNEHNGSPSVYFKNVLDWLSRMERKFLLDKKVLLMSTSPGKRGGIGALGVVESLIPRFGAEIISTFSLPSFLENFGADGITRPCAQGRTPIGVGRFFGIS